MSKRQFQLNEELTALAKSIEPDVLAGKPIAPEIVERLQQYTGSGGLIKQGAKDRGALYEYYTPYPIVESMWALAYKHGFKGGAILEPSCGIGRFLRYVDPTTSTVDAFEYSGDKKNTSWIIARASYPWATIFNAHFESIFYSGNKRVGRAPSYDLVIGNPPYGAFSGTYAGKSREGKYYNATRYDQYFIQAGIDLLKQGGLLVFIIPSAFLENGSAYNAAKERISQNAYLIDAYRLPQSIFDFTGIGTDIVVFKKKGA